MEYSKHTILDQLDRALSIPINRLYYVCRPRDISDQVASSTIPVPRFIMTVSGAKHIVASFDNGEVEHKFLQTGEAVYGEPNNQIEEYWDSEHEMISVSLPKSMIRAVFIRHDGISPPPYPLPNPTAYYHVLELLDQVGIATVQALNFAARKSTPDGTAAGGEDLLRSLLLQIREMISNDKGQDISKGHLLWREVFSFVSSNFNQPISRDMVAERFHIHPSHLSRIFKQELNTGFLEYVNSQRLSLAEELLHSPELNIDDVSQICGFDYTSYFIRVFKRKYGMPPGQFRDLMDVRKNKNTNRK